MSRPARDTEGIPLTGAPSEGALPVDPGMIPEHNANFLSQLFFSWQTSTLLKGFKQPLQMEDMHRLPSHLEANFNCIQVQKAWEAEVQRVGKLPPPVDATKPNEPSLLKALWTAYGTTWALAGIFQFLANAFQIGSPVLLQYFLAWLSTPTAKLNSEVGYGYVFGMFGLQILCTLSNNIFFMTTMRLGMRIRSGLVTAVYAKSLRLSARARATEFNAGKVTNIISTDTVRLDMVLPYIHMLWSAPLQIIVILGLLIRLLGPAALAGFGLMVLFMPIQGRVMKTLTGYRKDVQLITDQRVKLVNEVLQGVKIIKLFAWVRISWPLYLTSPAISWHLYNFKVF
jgi:hypothetical protein